ncbi:hypothetical protein pb186bvf_003099 [Paramecium bursaria]
MNKSYKTSIVINKPHINLIITYHVDRDVEINKTWIKLLLQNDILKCLDWLLLILQQKIIPEDCERKIVKQIRLYGYKHEIMIQIEINTLRYTNIKMNYKVQVMENNYKKRDQHPEQVPHSQLLIGVYTWIDLQLDPTNFKVMGPILFIEKLILLSFLFIKYIYGFLNIYEWKVSLFQRQYKNSYIKIIFNTLLQLFSQCITIKNQKIQESFSIISLKITYNKLYHKKYSQPQRKKRLWQEDSDNIYFSFDYKKKKKRDQHPEQVPHSRSFTRIQTWICGKNTTLSLMQ